MDDHNKNKKKRRWPRRLLIVVFAVLLLVGVLFAAVQTPPAKRYMAARITAKLSDMLPWPVEIQGIGGFLPFVASVDAVRLGEAEDPWLELSDATINMNLIPLFGGQVSIDRIGATTLVLHHLPESEDLDEPEPENPFSLPVLESLPDWIRLAQLQVDRVEIREAVFGQAVAFDVGGSYLPDEDDIVQLNVRGLDETDGDLSLTGGIRDRTVNLALDLRDATVLPALAGIEEPIALSLTVRGPYSSADVTLEARRGDDTVASLDLNVSYPEPLKVTGRGALALPADLTPPALLEKFGSNVALDLDLTLAEGETLTIAKTVIGFDHGQLSLAGVYDLAAGAMDLEPVLQHDDFHLLTGQVREGDPVAMVARVPLQGTLEALSIQPDMNVGGERFLDGEVELGLGESITAQGAVTLQPAIGVTPPEIKELLAEGANITLDVAYAEGSATFNDTAIRVGKTSLVVSGRANTETRLLDVTVRARAEDLQQFQGLAGTPLAGAVTADLTANGDGNQTVVHGSIQVENIVANTLRAPEGRVDLDITAGAFPDALTERITATLSGHFPQFQPQPDLARDLNLAGTVEVEELQRVTVSSLDISDGNLAILANGTVDLESRAADFTGTIQASQVGDYAAIANLPYRGAIDLDTSIASGDTPGSIVADVRGALSKLSGFPEPVDGLLGDSANISLQGRYDGELATLDNLEITSEQLRATGQGSYQVAERSLAATANGSLASLLPLSTLAGRPLSGAADFALEAEGPIDALDANGTITGTELDLDLLVADSAEVTFNASGIPSAISAQAQATLEQDGETLALGTELALADSRLDIDAFQLTAGENRVSARGVFDMAAVQGYGELDATLPDLAALKTWLKMPLGGSLMVQASLAEDTGALTGQLRAADLVADTLTVKQAEGQFDMDDLFGAPSGTANLTAIDLDAGQMNLASLTFTAEGPPSGMDLNLKTEGAYQEFTRFNVDAGGQFSNEAVAFDLRDLNFGVEGFTFVLQEPSMLRWREGVATLTPLVLASESGTLRAAGEYAPEFVDLRLEWQDLSLRLVELAGIDPMNGSVTGAVTIAGTPEAPELNAETIVAGYRPALDATMPGLDATIKVRISGGALDADLSATVPDSASFEGSAGLPVTFTLAPFAFRAPKGGPLTGALKGNADLAAISPLLPMEGHEMKGKLVADLGVGGTASSPRLNGAVTVADGYYENGSTSTILNDLEIRIEADGDTLRLAELTANDTAGGTVSGEGQMSFRPDAGSPFDFTLTLDKPRLVYRDDMRAEGSGELRFQGDSSGAKLSGDVTVTPAYILVPEGSDETKVTTVEFTEAGASNEEEEEEAPIYVIDLDLAIDLPGKIFVVGTGLDSEWEGNLKVTNTTAAPAIEGVLRVKKGTLDFLGRLFSLADSTITFDGQTPPSPYLRIDAVTETEDVVAHVRMEGVPDSINISLESEPSLPQDEILARVLFGQRLSDVSPVQALTLARYAPIFKRNQSGRRILGSQGPKPFLVDRVSLRSGSGAGEASIATGKYLSDDFYLEYEQGLGAAQSLISLDWLFAPHWSLRGKTTSQGQGGLGVFWKKDY